MKILRLFSGCLLACLFLTACHKAPDAADSYGKPIYLSDYQGKWVIVNYWATWCKPCLTELPALNALHKKYPEKLVVLGVSFDGLSNTDIQHFATSLPITFPLLANFPLAKFGITEIPSLPVTFIITPQGKLLKTLYGPQTETSVLKELPNIS